MSGTSIRFCNSCPELVWDNLCVTTLWVVSSFLPYILHHYRLLCIFICFMLWYWNDKSYNWDSDCNGREALKWKFQKLWIFLGIDKTNSVHFFHSTKVHSSVPSASFHSFEKNCNQQPMISLYTLHFSTKTGLFTFLVHALCIVHFPC